MTNMSHIEQIGAVAGKIWGTLAEQGPQSLTKLVKLVGESRDLVMQAIGWLAREDKIQIIEEGRTRLATLK